MLSKVQMNMEFAKSGFLKGDPFKHVVVLKKNGVGVLA